MPQCRKPPPESMERPFSIRTLRPERQWAADMDYLRSLKHSTRPEDKAAYAWMTRFVNEYYGHQNDLLNPKRHFERCPKCKAGKACVYRPPETPLHASAELRKGIHRAKYVARFDVMSVGRVSLWEDMGQVSETGEVPARRGQQNALRPRVEAGDYFGDSAESAAPSSAPVIRKARK